MNVLVGVVVRRSQTVYRRRHIAFGYFFFTLVPVTLGPLLIALAGPAADELLRLGRLVPGGMSTGAAIGCFVLGMPWLIWGAAMDWAHGSGTPLPWFPPKRLLVTGPYRLLRNPQVFGALFWWSGWALVFNSPAGFVIAGAVIPGIVATYIHFVEEGELAQRFGREYLEYKSRTPFILGSHLASIWRNGIVQARPAPDPIAERYEFD